jgi:hypothetical protein
MASFVRSRVVVLFASLASFASTLVVDACSADDATAVDPNAPDAAEAAPRDGTVVFEDADPSCDPDADLLTRVEDASIADGASTTGICAACLRERCAEQIASCAEDCPCQGIVGDALQCYLTTQQLACLGRLTNYLISQDTRARALTLAGCARSGCGEECAIDGGTIPDATTDTTGQ